MVPRGRIELPTPAFSGPRSTGELPRHGTEIDFTENRRAAQSGNADRNLPRNLPQLMTSASHVKKRATQGHHNLRRKLFEETRKRLVTASLIAVDIE